MVGRVAVMLGVLAQPMVVHSEEAVPQPTEPTEEVTLETFEGVYMYAGGERQKQAIRDEIDAATEDLNVALRGLARRKIWKSQEPSTRMTIVVEGDRVSIVRSGDKPAFSGTIGGSTFPVEDEYVGRLKWKNGKILVDVTGGDQHTTVTFSLDPQTHTVTTRTIISHPMLPRTVKITKTFRSLG